MMGVMASASLGLALLGAGEDAGTGEGSKYPVTDLHSIAVCGMQHRALRPMVLEGEGPLMRIAVELARTRAEKRAASLSCLREELRFGAVLPDGGLVVSTGIQRTSGEVVPCAAWIAPPLQIPHAAVYRPVPTDADPNQQVAFISESDAADVVDAWNAALVYEVRRRDGVTADAYPELPPGTVYVAAWSDRPVSVIGAQEQLALPAAGWLTPPKAYRDQLPLSEALMNRSQVTGALTAFAAERPEQRGRTLTLFAGIQAPADARGGAAEPARLDAKGIAQRVRDALEAQAAAGVEIPAVRIARLAHDASSAPKLAFEAIEPTAAPLLEPPPFVAEVAAPLGRTAGLAAWVAAGLALFVAVLALVDLIRNSVGRTAAKARDPNVKVEDMLSAFAARHRAVGRAGHASALVALAAVGVLWAYEGWTPAWVPWVGAVGVLLLSVVPRRSQAWMAAFPDRARTLADDLDRLNNSGASEEARWTAERQLRTELVDGVQGRLRRAVLWRQLRPARLSTIAAVVAAGLAIIAASRTALETGAKPVVAEASPARTEVVRESSTGSPRSAAPSRARLVSKQLMDKCLKPDQPEMKLDQAFPPPPPPAVAAATPPPPPTGGGGKVRSDGEAVPTIGDTEDTPSRDASEGAGRPESPEDSSARERETKAKSTSGGYIQEAIPYLETTEDEDGP